MWSSSSVNILAMKLLPSVVYVVKYIGPFDAHMCLSWCVVLSLVVCSAACLVPDAHVCLSWCVVFSLVVCSAACLVPDAHVRLSWWVVLSLVVFCAACLVLECFIASIFMVEENERKRLG
jgi:hypothetical protein